MVLIIARHWKMVMTTSPSHDSYKYNDQAKLNALTATVVQYIDKIYEYLDTEIEYRNETFIKSRCFIHGGDNPTALNLYPNGDIRVHYKCRTHECEEIFGSSLISLIRGGLSRLRYGWKVKGDKEATFNETIEFILEFTQQDFKNLSSRNSTLDGDKLRFSSLVNGFTMPSQQKEGIQKEFYRSKVEIPSQYYLQRGYSIEVLDKYDVGTCKRPKKSLYQRAVVPIYDDNGEVIVGFTGRSIFNECSQCKHYHDPEKECHFFPKWKHTAGFQKENCLYNYWYAKEHILQSGVVVVVESPGNVWRLEEAGIHNAVAIFGAHLGPNQKKLIDSSGAFSIVCLLDNDEAGVKGAKKIYEQCSKMYRLYFPKFNANDIGDMNVDNVTSDIKPLITQLGEVYNG